MPGIGNIPPSTPPLPPAGAGDNQQLITDLTATVAHLSQLAEVVLNIIDGKPPDPNLPSLGDIEQTLSQADRTALLTDSSSLDPTSKTYSDLLWLVSQIDGTSISNYVQTAENSGSVDNINGESFSLMAYAQQVLQDLA